MRTFFSCILHRSGTYFSLKSVEFKNLIRFSWEECVKINARAMLALATCVSVWLWNFNSLSVTTHRSFFALTPSSCSPWMNRVKASFKYLSILITNVGKQSSFLLCYVFIHYILFIRVYIFYVRLCGVCFCCCIGDFVFHYKCN